MASKTACIIDDDEIYVFALKSLLNSMEFDSEVVVCEDGQVGLDYCKYHMAEYGKLPDVIFLDINMPVMDGWEFLDELIQTWPAQKQKTTLFMVSSSVTKQDLERAKSYSVISEYVPKPLDREGLLELLLIL